MPKKRSRPIEPEETKPEAGEIEPITEEMFTEAIEPIEEPIIEETPEEEPEEPEPIKEPPTKEEMVADLEERIARAKAASLRHAGYAKLEEQLIDLKRSLKE